MPTRVVGIDPAPGKKSHVFDGERMQELRADELATYLEGLHARPDVLLCWDAPLTGPAFPDDRIYLPGDHTQRPIEQFFSRSEPSGGKLKAPKGISVLPYGQCPHWTITRRLLGLPRVGKHDSRAEDLPFELITAGEHAPGARPKVVEVHPALALWLWCRRRRHHGSWEYKKSATALRGVWKTLCNVLRDCEDPAVLAVFEHRRPADDDQCDAYVSWILGRLWTTAPGSVRLLGDAQSGSLLLPDYPEMADMFEAFR